MNGGSSENYMCKSALFENILRQYDIETSYWWDRIFWKIWNRIVWKKKSSKYKNLLFFRNILYILSHDTLIFLISDENNLTLYRKIKIFIITCILYKIDFFIDQIIWIPHLLLIFKYHEDVSSFLLDSSVRSSYSFHFFKSIHVVTRDMITKSTVIIFFIISLFSLSLLSRSAYFFSDFIRHSFKKSSLYLRIWLIMISILLSMKMILSLDSI